MQWSETENMDADLGVGSSAALFPFDFQNGCFNGVRRCCGGMCRGEEAETEDCAYV